MNVYAIQLSRWLLGLCWVYQGFFPKLYAIAPLERQLTATMGFTVEISDVITRVAGVSEIVFGLLLIVFYKTKIIHFLNILALLSLLLYVALMMPSLLIEAFNPITTNLTMMALSVVILVSIRPAELWPD